MSAARVLLVDDDASVRSALARALVSEGFAVTALAEADLVLRSVEREPPDIVLLDLRLGGASGWDVFEELSRKYPLITVVIITARVGQLDVAKLAGVGALLEKPIEIPALVSVMRGLLTEDEQTRLARLARQTPSPRFVPGRPRKGAFPRSLS